MLTIGSMVYWVDGQYQLQRGEVMAINATSHDSHGTPRQICVCTAGNEFLILGNESWSPQYHQDIGDAVTDALERLAKERDRNHTQFLELRKQEKAMKAIPPTPNV